MGFGKPIQSRAKMNAILMIEVEWLELILLTWVTLV